MQMIEIGQKVRFDPFAESCGGGVDSRSGSFVVATVTYVNEPHRWFMCEYRSSIGERIKASFQFWQVGKQVKLCG